MLDKKIFEKSKSFIILLFALLLVSGLTACSGFSKPPTSGNLGAGDYLNSGSVSLAQKIPANTTDALLIGFLPSVPVGKEFSSSGTLVVKKSVPSSKTHSPLIGFFGRGSMQKSGSLDSSNLGFNNTGTIVLSGNLAR